MLVEFRVSAKNRGGECHLTSLQSGQEWLQIVWHSDEAVAAFGKQAARWKVVCVTASTGEVLGAPNGGPYGSRAFRDSQG
jgi:hypothetical protein